MGKIPSRKEAEALLKEYNNEPFHLRHALMWRPSSALCARIRILEEFWGMSDLSTMWI
jgi:hypothetical protein